MDDRLAGAWHRLTEPLGAPGGEVRRVLDDLAGRYAEPHRAYHGLAHLRHVLATLDMLLASGERADDPTAVRLAAWFHDAVYLAGDDGNELASAELARVELGRLGAAEDRTERVAAMVLATRDHVARDADESLLVDADLAILAAEPAAYDLYRRGVRVEHPRLSEEQWRTRRAAFLRAMLARDRIYVTATMRERGEQPARRNLREELATLSTPA